MSYNEQIATDGCDGHVSFSCKNRKLWTCYEYLWARLYTTLTVVCWRYNTQPNTPLRIWTKNFELERRYYILKSFWRMMSISTYDLNWKISESMKWLLHMSPRWWDAIHYKHAMPLVISASWSWVNKNGKVRYIGLKRQTGQVDGQVQGSYTVRDVFGINYYPHLPSAVTSFC